MPYSNNHNPYSHNNGANPYGSNNNDPFGSNQVNQQRQLQKEQEQRQYKQACEISFDNIVADFKSAKKNNVELIINEANKSAINRYFKRYWDNKFISLALLILIITTILSFFTIYASFAVVLVFIAKYSYSQSSFTRYFLNDSDVLSEDMKEIETLIFNHKLNMKFMFLVTLGLTLSSIIISFYSTNILINSAIEEEKLIKFIISKSSFDIENELFAYFNIFSISILMLFKTIEKWKK